MQKKFEGRVSQGEECEAECSRLRLGRKRNTIVGQHKLAELISVGEFLSLGREIILSLQCADLNSYHNIKT